MNERTIFDYTMVHMHTDWQIEREEALALPQTSL